MTSKEFRIRLDRLGLTYAECARRAYVEYRTITRYANDERRIPGAMIALLECWDRERQVRGVVGAGS